MHNSYNYMINIIKLQTTRLYNQSKVRKYEITHEGLVLFASIKPRAQELFIELLNRIRYNIDISSILIECTYKDLGFNSRRNFLRYRQELIECEFIFVKKNTFYINPLLVNYYTRRQRDYFFNLFSIKKNINIVMNVPKLIKVM